MIDELPQLTEANKHGKLGEETLSSTKCAKTIFLSPNCNSEELRPDGSELGRREKGKEIFGRLFFFFDAVVDRRRVIQPRSD